MQKTIILGAGASFDFGFPTGIELCEEIYKGWLNPNDKYIKFYKHHLKDGEKNESEIEKSISDLAYQFYYSGALSVDDFLSRLNNKVDIDFGKMTITDLILKKENDSVSNQGGKQLFQWRNNWLRKIFAKEFRFETVEELIKKIEESPVRFITFNYDRSLEYYLFTAIKNYYGDGQKAKEIYKTIEIHHIYGKLGPLEGEVNDDTEHFNYGESYGRGSDENKIYKCSSNIKVINENKNGAKQIIEKCYQWIKQSDKVYILGFGFLNSNYKLLGIDDYKESCKGKIPENKFIYTSYGLSESEKRTVREKFGFAKDDKCRATEYPEMPIYDFFLHEYRFSPLIF